MGFVLARDVAPDEDVDDPMSLVADVRLTCELVRSRFQDRRAVGWPSFAGDLAGCEALVVGPSIGYPHWQAVMQSLDVRVDDATRVRCAVDDDVTDPLAAFTDLLAIARERRMRLPRGSVISTGSMSVPFDLDRSSALRATCCDGELAFSLAFGPVSG